MHPFDDNETISLEVIDATLAGEAVAPEHVELAELTLILAGQRSVPDGEFTAALDARVARRFHRSSSPTPVRRRWRWLFAPGAAVGALAAIVAVIVLSGGGNLGGESFSSTSSAASSAAANGSRARPVARRAAKLGAVAPGSRAAASAPAAAQTSSSASAAAQGQALTPDAAPVPTTTGRQIVQSAQLSLSTKPSNVDGVAQQVFDVIAAQNGVVRSSQVTAANNADGYAQFALSVPSSNLGQTMAALSRLHAANVVSRSDSTQDITQQVGGVGMRLADARALHTALVHKLAAATTTTEIDSLNAQIGAVEARIARLEASLHSLHRRVDLSNISLTINAAAAPGHPVTSGGGFTLGKAAHDAGRVLVIAAGVALITLAVLVPLGMVIAVALWIASAIRRRRREQALDLV